MTFTLILNGTIILIIEVFLYEEFKFFFFEKKNIFIAYILALDIDILALQEIGKIFVLIWAFSYDLCC